MVELGKKPRSLCWGPGCCRWEQKGKRNCELCRWPDNRLGRDMWPTTLVWACSWCIALRLAGVKLGTANFLFHGSLSNVPPFYIVKRGVFSPLKCSRVLLTKGTWCCQWGPLSVCWLSVTLLWAFLRVRRDSYTISLELISFNSP